MQFYIAGSQVGLPTMQMVGKSLPVEQQSPEAWREAGHLEQGKRPSHAVRATPTVDMTRAASGSPLTYFSSTMLTLETNLYLQACHQAEYIRKLLQAPDKSSSFKKTWASKGVELTDKQLLQPKNFCNAEEGRGDSSDRGPSQICFSTDRALDVFPFPMHRPRLCKTPGGR